MGDLNKTIDRVAEVCKKKEFTLRELFNALDVDGDGIITKNDLKVIAKSDGESKYISKNDLQNLYCTMGKKICQGFCEIMDDGSGQDYVTIDEFLKILDKNQDGKVKFGDFLRLAKKDGNLMFITEEELEDELKGYWKKPGQA